MKKWIVLISIGLCACSPQPDPQGGVRAYGFRGQTVYEFKLDDGTRCVMTYSGGIDCEWRTL